MMTCAKCETKPIMTVERIDEWFCTRYTCPSCANHFVLTDDQDQVHPTESTAIERVNVAWYRLEGKDVQFAFIDGCIYEIRYMSEDDEWLLSDYKIHDNGQYIQLAPPSTTVVCESEEDAWRTAEMWAEEEKSS